jgi:hypothetical protein
MASPPPAKRQCLSELDRLLQQTMERTAEPVLNADAERVVTRLFETYDAAGDDGVFRAFVKDMMYARLPWPETVDAVVRLRGPRPPLYVVLAMMEHCDFVHWRECFGCIEKLEQVDRDALFAAREHHDIFTDGSANWDKLLLVLRGGEACFETVVAHAGYNHSSIGYVLEHLVQETPRYEEALGVVTLVESAHVGHRSAHDLEMVDEAMRQRKEVVRQLELQLAAARAKWRTLELLHAKIKRIEEYVKKD